MFEYGALAKSRAVCFLILYYLGVNSFNSDVNYPGLAPGSMDLRGQSYKTVLVLAGFQKFQVFRPPGICPTWLKCWGSHDPFLRPPVPMEGLMLLAFTYTQVCYKGHSSRTAQGGDAQGKV